jgi:hypothetical protein
MLEYLKLHNVGPSPSLELHLAPRLNLITGDNGLGKSFLLDAAWWALTRKWPRELNAKLVSGYPARPNDIKQPASIKFGLKTSARKKVAYECKYVPRDEAWLGRAGRPPNPGLVIYAQADGGFSVWDPARNYWKTKGDMDVQERLPAYVFSPQQVWDGLEIETGDTKKVVCNGLIRDWANWIREDGPISKLMAGLLMIMSPSTDPGDQLQPGPLERMSLDDARDIPTIRMGSSKAVPILHASSGVRRIVALAYMLLWCKLENIIAAKQLGEKNALQVIILIDEIESHLHPRWQRSILRAIYHMNIAMHMFAEVQLIVATHSPLVLASAEPLFDPAMDAWLDLDLDRTAKIPVATIQQRPFVRQGDVSNWLTSEAFDLKSARSLEAETAIEKAHALLRQTKRPSRADVAAVDKLLRAAALPDIDPFWVRWGNFVEKIGAAK